MFGIGANELVLIIIFGFILLGPDKLPAMAKTIGRAIARFRAARSEMDKVIQDEILKSDNPADSLAGLFGISEKEKQIDEPDLKNIALGNAASRPKISADYLYGLSHRDKKEE